MKRSTVVLVLFVLMSVVVFGCSQEPAEEPQDILTVAEEAGDFTTLLAAIDAAGLTDVLKGEGPFTVFAPTDDAFAALPAGTVENLLLPENLEALQNILTYHVVAGNYMAADVLEMGTLVALNEMELMVELMNDQAQVNGVNIISTDIVGSNGVIHVIEAVILPAEEPQDILTVAEEAGDFTTLLAAIDAAGLTDVLKGEGPFTVFAPTDDAFAALPAGTVEDLLLPENLETLQNILTYHVVAGNYMAADVLEMGNLAALNEKELMVELMNDHAQINGVNIISTDIVGSNGVIHVIEAVILP